MKKLLIILPFVLSVATTGMFAQDVTTPVAPDSSTTKTAPAKAGKHGKKHHLRAKGKKGQKGHKQKQHKKARHTEQPAPVQPEQK